MSFKISSIAQKLQTLYYSMLKFSLNDHTAAFTFHPTLGFDSTEELSYRYIKVELDLPIYQSSIGLVADLDNHGRTNFGT